MAEHHSMRGRSIGARLFGGRAVIGTGIAVGAGAIAGVAGAFLTEHTDFFNKHWYALPLGVFVVGHLGRAAKNEMIHDAGTALCGSAGTMAYYNFKLNQASVSASKPTETTGVQNDTGSPMVDYVRALKALPDTTGVQDYSAPRRSNPIHSMRAAA